MPEHLPFSFEKPQDSLGFLLWQTTMTWQRLIRKELDTHDLSHAQFVIMALLHWLIEHDYAPTQATIMQWSQLDKMTISQALKKLESRGLVNRSEHATDTRAKISRLTAEGAALITVLVPKIEAVDSSFFAPLSAEEQQVLIALFSKIFVN